MLTKKIQYEKGQAVTVIMDGFVELVGRFVSIDDQGIELDYTHVVILQPNARGESDMTLRSIANTVDPKDSNYVIPLAKIIAHKQSRADVDEHLRAQDSGIVLK